MDKIRVIINNKQTIKIPTGLRMLIRRCCNAVLRLEGFKGSADISVTLVSNDQIKILNKKYREKDYPTDVLSFPTGENGNFEQDPASGVKILGDVVISVEKAQEQADRFGYALQKEVAALTAHAVLHLLGHDHEKGSEQLAKMREKEMDVLNRLGFTGVFGYAAEK